MERLGETRPAAPAVIDAKFCSPHAMNLIVKREKLFLSSTHFKVLDDRGHQLLKIVEGDSFMDKDWLILDATGSPIATLLRKVSSLYFYFYQLEWSNIVSTTEKLFFSVVRFISIRLILSIIEH